jgi:hypothetical protein
MSPDQTRDQRPHQLGSAVPPPDPVAHEDGLLMADVTAMNTELGRYVLRFLDADSGRAEPLSVTDELALADKVTAVADGLRARAVRRQRDGDPTPLIGPATSTGGDR